MRKALIASIIMPLALLGSVASVPLVQGCQLFSVASLTTIASIVNDAFSVLSIIDAAANQWFSIHPDQKVRDEYTVVFTKAVAALNVANHALAGSKDVSQKDYDSAFTEFRQSYSDLRSLLNRVGIASGDRIGVSGSVVVLPEPQALTYQVR
jgi:tRNA A37 threonylcarbamoyladenosine modification protein TsaB